MGSGESHFNVSVGSDGQSHNTVSTNHNLSEEKKRAEAVSNRGPSAYQPNTLLLGHTSSQLITHDDGEVLLSVLRCQLTYYLGQVVTNAKAQFNKSLCPRKPEGSLRRTAQDVHLDSRTAPEL